MRGSKLSPHPLGPILGIDHPAHPLIPLTTCPRLQEAQGVLKRAADVSKIADPREKAILDVIDPAGERREVPSEHLSHQLRIAGDLKLGKGGLVGTCGKTYGHPDPARSLRAPATAVSPRAAPANRSRHPRLSGGSDRSPPRTRRLNAERRSWSHPRGARS